MTKYTSDGGKIMSEKPITSMSVTYNVAIVNVDNIPNNTRLISEIFNTIAESNINVDMISQAAPFKGVINLSFSIPSDDILKAISTLNMFKKTIPKLSIQVDADNTKISVFGELMKNLPGVAATLFSLLAEEGIDIKMITTSEVDISCLLYDRDVDKADKAIREKFDL